MRCSAGHHRTDASGPTPPGDRPASPGDRPGAAAPTVSPMSILALDAGTTGVTALLVSADLAVIAPDQGHAVGQIDELEDGLEQVIAVRSAPCHMEKEVQLRGGRQDEPVRPALNRHQRTT